MKNKKLILSYILVFAASWVLHIQLSKVVSKRMYARFYSCALFETEAVATKCAENTKPEGWENIVVF